MDTSKPGSLERLTLLIDADDTLWENNIYFIAVTERFLEVVEGRGVTPDVARATLSDTEWKNIPVHGYGSRAFAISVVEALRVLAPEIDIETVDELRRLAHAIFDREQLEIRPGVREALSLLGRHHRLVLVTKGDKEEQERKVQRSGLMDHFEWIEVVPEKDELTYRELVRRLGADPARTWMIGNSPRSDINPALQAGLNAVLVPHPSTWELEIEEVVEAGDRLRVVESLVEVADLFVSDGSNGHV